MRMLLLVGLLLVMTAMMLHAGCRKEEKRPVATPTPSAAKDEMPAPPADEEEKAVAPEPEEQAKTAEDTLTATIRTTKGDILVELYPKEAPKTVANFLKLAQAGYYDDMAWHRVVPGFVIQTGQGDPQPTIPDEVNQHVHRPGALAMAKQSSRSDPTRLSEPDSASSQFYITLRSAEEAEYLNAEYTVFGQVREGMDVARRITREDRVKTIEVLDGDE